MKGEESITDQVSFMLKTTTVKGMIDYYETKAHPITKKMVLDACKEIKANGKAAGVDEVSLVDYAKDLQRNLYRL